MNIADQFIKLDRKIRSGTLCTFGCWFGRPMDNFHESVSATFDGEILRIEFEAGETLEIWNPSELTVVGTTFRIQKASKVKWTWHYYGKPKSNDTLMYYEYQAVDGDIKCKTNSSLPNKPSANQPAVELC